MKGEIELHESETLELKREWSERALEDLAAFANMRGGTLLIELIGIDDDGTVVGADIRNARLRWLVNQNHQ